jgi:histidine triad (HIT) family protein
MQDCIFCKIIAKQIPCKSVYEDEQFIAFHDIHPKAPVHLLVVPKQHIPSLETAQVENGPLLADALLLLPRIAKENGLNQGFRTVINTGAGGGQEVFHIHFHILGGKNMPGM